MALLKNLWTKKRKSIYSDCRQWSWRHPFLKNRVRQTAPGQGRLTISGIALTDYKIHYFKTWAKSKAILVSHCLTRVGYAFNVYESWIINKWSEKQKSVIDYCKTTDMTCFPVQMCMQPTSLVDISTCSYACIKSLKDDGMRFVDDYITVMIYIAFSELVEYQTHNISNHYEITGLIQILNTVGWKLFRGDAQI